MSLTDRLMGFSTLKPTSYSANLWKYIFKIRKYTFPQVFLINGLFFKFQIYCHSPSADILTSKMFLQSQNSLYSIFQIERGMNIKSVKKSASFKITRFLCAR